MKTKNNNKINNGIKFLLIMCALYIVCFFADQKIALDSLIGTGVMFYKILPVLVLVFFIQIITNLYLTEKKVEKFLGNQSGWVGWLYSSIAGILVSGPPYILFPLLSDLKKKGMKNELMAVFLYNRNVKIPFIPVMIYYFGLAFTIITSVYIIIFSIFNGLLIGHLAKENN